MIVLILIIYLAALLLSALLVSLTFTFRTLLSIVEVSLFNLQSSLFGVLFHVANEEKQRSLADVTRNVFEP